MLAQRVLGRYADGLASVAVGVAAQHSLREHRTVEIAEFFGS